MVVPLLSHDNSFLVPEQIYPISPVFANERIPYEEANHPLSSQSNHRFLLITGCSRSGTKYISKVLTYAGLDIGHESLGRAGTASWVMAVKAQNTPWGPGRNNLEFDHIFHQVRHPLKVISSAFMTEGVKSWGYIMPHLPEVHKEDSWLVKCAKFWYYWNLKAEALAEWTYRVEDLPHIWKEFETRLGLSLNPRGLTLIPQNLNERHQKPPSRKTNTTFTDFTWEDLEKALDPELYQNLRDLALRYGYLD